MIELINRKFEANNGNNEEVARLRVLRNQIRAERSELKSLLTRFEASRYRQIYSEIIREMNERISDITEVLEKYQSKP